ncbi:C4-dicarboxylate ABC transporter permease [Sedimentitalea sp. CY04]|uniref:TRAP transporter small permease protein n=1 Tax=Parasedimentitalea denitrificans TaxID=2211118 RepID=A0ABX0W7P0_9RHOB|nr:TRAP transporter small permease subunit [Sedimentitalea sp. CY04]NIZ61659.1 C4-dicarboxylate ABC transporter permease [Sedimentitalea sp. CY04]
MLYLLSRSWAKMELWCSAFLALMITLLILLNVATRSLGAALFWVDELAIYTMVWMTFFGASAAMHYRTSVSITLLTDAVPLAVKAIIEKVVDLIVFAFAIAVVWFCWRWFSPLELARAGFDTVAFQGATFNFIYAEPTSTLGVPKYLFWLVMWFFAFGAVLHSAMHLFSNPVREADQ